MKNIEARPHTISPEIRLYLRRGFIYSQITRVHPFVWGKGDTKPELRTGTLNTFFWMLNILMTTTYWLFVVFRCIQHLEDPEANLAVQIYLKFTVVYYAFPVMFHIVIGLKREAIIDLSCQSLNFIDWIDRKMNFEAKKLMKTSKFILCYIFYGLISISIFVVVYAFIFPNSPEMISSVLPDRSWEVSILCALFQAYIEFTFHTQCFLIQFGCFAAIIPCLAVAGETR